MMKSKIIFFGCLLFYLAIGTLPRVATEFIDMKSLDEVRDHKIAFFLIIVSLMVGAGFLIWIKTIFPYQCDPKQDKKWYRDVLFFIIFSCFAFAINTGWVFGINTLFIKEERNAQLVVMNKKVKKSRRSASYRLDVKDIQNNKIFEFKVNEN